MVSMKQRNWVLFHTWRIKQSSMKIPLEIPIIPRHLLGRLTFHHCSWKASIQVYSSYPLTAHSPFRMRPIFVLYPTLTLNTIVFFFFTVFHPTSEQHNIRHPAVNSTSTELSEIFSSHPPTAVYLDPAAASSRFLTLSPGLPGPGWNRLS